MQIVDELFLPKKDCSAHLSLFEGMDAIDVEDKKVLHVRVSQISCDDWGIKATVTDSLKPGFNRPQRNPGQLASCWDYFSWTPIFWQSRMIFRLYFDPILVRECTKLGERVQTQRGSIADEWLALRQNYDFLVRLYIPLSWNRISIPQASEEAAKELIGEITALTDQIKTDNTSVPWEELVQYGHLNISCEQWNRWTALTKRVREMSRQERNSFWRELGVPVLF